MAKQYGLILPSKSKLTLANTIKKPSIFEEESGSEEEIEKPTGLPSTVKRQDRITREKAVEEDPTVYQYDEVYDRMEQDKKESKLSQKGLDKKPKYINRLIAAAEKRKRENERRIERQVQKEREAEGDEFKDKESFVTTAYRKKLEELKKQEEEEKREEYLEAVGDVKKQGNLDGFYRHLYDQKVNYSNKLKSENVEKQPDTKALDKDQESPSHDTQDDNSKDNSKIHIKHASQKRTYRKRESSESDDKEENEEEKKLEHLPSNIDADSDFSIDSDTEDSEDETKPKKAKTEEKSNNEEKCDDEKSKEANIKNDIEVKDEDKSSKEEPKKVEEITAIKKPKIDIWKKRTVGVVFEEALQRYYERKALREAAK